MDNLSTIMQFFVIFLSNFNI